MKIRLNFEDFRSELVNSGSTNDIVSEYEVYKQIFDEMLIKSLHECAVYVAFTKIDGSKRTILCTLNPALIPIDMQPKNTVNRENHSAESSTISVFEVNLKKWRSFRKDTLIEWYLAD